MMKTQVYTLVGTLIGLVVGTFIVFMINGDFSIEVIAGGLVGLAFWVAFHFITNKKRNPNIPEADERTVENLLKYFAFLGQITIFILFLAVAIFILLGKEAIPTIYLLGFFFGYLFIAAIGGIIVKNR